MHYHDTVFLMCVTCRGLPPFRWRSKPLPLNIALAGVTVRTLSRQCAAAFAAAGVCPVCLLPVFTTRPLIRSIRTLTPMRVCMRVRAVRALTCNRLQRSKAVCNAAHPSTREQAAPAWNACSNSGRWLSPSVCLFSRFVCWGMCSSSGLLSSRNFICTRQRRRSTTGRRTRTSYFFDYWYLECQLGY